MNTAIWPSRDDYQIVVRQPERHLKDRRLHRMQVETRVLGVPFPRSGNFGAVYKFSNSREAYALKVFDKAQKDRQLRYKLIDEHLKQQPASANLLSFSYDEEGILVNVAGGNEEDSLPLEHPGDATQAPQAPAAHLKDLANFARRAVPIFGEDVAQHGHATRAVALVGHFGVGLQRFAAAAFLDGSLDVVLGHAVLAGLVYRVSQGQV